MRKLLFDLGEFIEVLENLRDGGCVEILVSEHEGYPTLADAADPSNVLILKPADHVDLPSGKGNGTVH